MNTISNPPSRRSLQVYLIDVISRCVSVVPYDGSLKRLYELIDCDLIDSTARQPNRDGIFCTDMLPDEPQLPAFRLRSTGQILYRNGVWAGCDREGNTVSPATPLEQVQRDIEFLGLIPYRPTPIRIIAW
jgi:hypothetical protein